MIASICLQMWKTDGKWCKMNPDSKVHWANKGPTGSCRPQKGPMLAPWTCYQGPFALHRLVSLLEQPSTLQWRHNGCDSVSNYQPRDCFLNRLFRHRSKKTSKLRVTSICAGNSPETGEFPLQMASNAWLVTQKMFPFDDVIMRKAICKSFICSYFNYCPRVCLFCHK